MLITYLIVLLKFLNSKLKNLFVEQSLLTVLYEVYKPGLAHLWSCKAFWGACDLLAEQWSYAYLAVNYHGKWLAEPFLSGEPKRPSNSHCSECTYVL